VKRAGIFYDFIARGQAAQRGAERAGELVLLEELIKRLMSAAATVYNLDDFTGDHGRYAPLLEQLNAQLAGAIARRDDLR
jgi:hypothetical protein